MNESDLARLQALTARIGELESGTDTTGEAGSTTELTVADYEAKVAGIVLGMTDQQLQAAYERVAADPDDTAAPMILTELVKRGIATA